MMQLFINILILLTACKFSFAFNDSTNTIMFSWKCINNKCIKESASNVPTEEITSFDVCMLFCGPSIIWPQPVQLTLSGVPETIKSFSIILSETTKMKTIPKRLGHMMVEAENVFRGRIKSKRNQPLSTLLQQGVHELKIQLEIDNVAEDLITLSTNESYTLSVTTSQNVILADIKGDTYFGVRHGLETLSQLIVYDKISNGLVIPTQVAISDFPKFPYRGVMLDTSRNYISVESIKRTIDAMAANKLNRFHWHITDAQSFPLILENFEQFAEYGAYSPEKVYTKKDVESLLEYALIRGIRIVPELNTPGRASEGWQWTPYGTVICNDKEPWLGYCDQPPCGQLNPLSEHVYNILGEMYKDYIRLFKPEMFHMGNDEVNFKCWNSSKEIQNWLAEKYPKQNENEHFFSLWGMFQQKALTKLQKAGADLDHKPDTVIWTSSLTQAPNLKHLKHVDYIIQVRTGKEETVNNLLQNNYRIILSNHGLFSLDSGFESWDYEKQSKYIQWRQIYDDVGFDMDNLPEEKRDLILGLEAVLWTNSASEGSLDNRLWPRAAALAERGWTNPGKHWDAAESRMLYNRDRLQQLGFGAAAIEPEWCILNRGGCS